MDSNQITYPVTFALRRGLSADLYEVNEILHQGEPVIEIDTLKIKIGDGKLPYNELEYVGASELSTLEVDITKLQDQLNAFLASAEIGDAAVDTLLEIQKILNDSSINIADLLQKVAEFEALHTELNTKLENASLDRKAIRDDMAGEDQRWAQSAAAARKEIYDEVNTLKDTCTANNASTNERIDRVEEYYRAADKEIIKSVDDLTAIHYKDRDAVIAQFREEISTLEEKHDKDLDDLQKTNDEFTTQSTTGLAALDNKIDNVELNAGIRMSEIEESISNEINRSTEIDNRFDQEFIKVYEEMKTLDGKVNALPANELEVLKVDYAAHKEESSTNFTNINTALEEVNSEINGKLDNATSDRAAIRNDLSKAISMAQEDRALMREQYATLDNALKISYEAADTSIRAEFAAADLTLTTSLNEEIARATAAEADALAQSKAYTDSVKTAILGSEQLESTFNTLTNIAAWIEGDGVNATELTEAIAVEVENRGIKDAAIIQSITDLNTAINTTINELDIAHKAAIKSTNDTVAALGTELRGVDSNINARLDAAIAAHEAEDARIDAAYKVADSALEESIKQYLDDQLGVIANGKY